MQTKLQELEVFDRQSPNGYYRTTTPSSRDSGVPIRSSSSCCSLTSESTSTPKSSFELPFEQPQTQLLQKSIIHCFLHPPINPNHRHVSVHLNDEATGMLYDHDNNLRCQSHERSVHWNDERLISSSCRSSRQHVFQEEHQFINYNSNSKIIKGSGQRISLNASLPYDSKLNIRIHADRTGQDNTNENAIDQVKATATVEPLNDSRYEQEYFDTLQRNCFQHYSTVSSNDNLIITASPPIQQRESRRDKLPRHRQVSLPVSLPVNERLYLYIQNGEVLARC